MGLHIAIILIIAVFAGVMGGLVSYYGLMNNRASAPKRTPDNGASDGVDGDADEGSADPTPAPTPVPVPADPFDPSPWPPVIRGVAAALITPLFLQAVSSNLLSYAEDANGASMFPMMNYLMFGATCLVAAISSRAFIGNVSKRVLDAASEAGASAGQRAARHETVPLKKEAVENKSAITQLKSSDAAMRADVKELASTAVRSVMPAGRMPDNASGTSPGTSPGTPPSKTPTGVRNGSRVIEEARSPARPIDVWSSDPHKGKFGGSNTKDGWTLGATVAQRGSSRSFFDVTLTVTAPPGAAIADRMVEFHLHPTFSPNVMRMPLDESNVAVLKLTAGGSFTVGAIANGGAMKLELDLADGALVDAPQAFRDQ